MAVGDETNDLVSFNDDSTQCILCDNPISVYSYGSCGHYVCFVCASKMRVICHQLYCPVCRTELNQVYFSREAPKKGHLPEATKFNDYGICFVDDDIRSEFDKLFENRCSLCDGLFDTFQAMSNHMSQEHRKAYCKICFASLKLYPFERRFYSREEFARHSICGDEDDNSFTGHPLCTFCKKRFFDKDELYRHSTVEHFYCSFCAVDGKVTFYKEYEELREHFRHNHFLCEHPGCRNLELRSHVFQTEIELKSHVLECHTEHNKQARRQAGQVAPDYFFDFAAARGGQNRRHDSQHDVVPAQTSDNDQASGVPVENVPCDFSEENFPSLEAVTSNGFATTTKNTNYDSHVRNWLADNLPGPRTTPATPVTTTPQQIRPTYAKQSPSSCAYAKVVLPSRKFDLDDDEFPSLPTRKPSASTLPNVMRPQWADKAQSRKPTAAAIRQSAPPRTPSPQTPANSATPLPKPADFPALSRPKPENRPAPRAQSSCWSLKSIGQSLRGHEQAPCAATAVPVIAAQAKPASFAPTASAAFVQSAAPVVIAQAAGPFTNIANRPPAAPSPSRNAQPAASLKEEDFPQLSTSRAPPINKSWRKAETSSSRVEPVTHSTSASSASENAAPNDVAASCCAKYIPPLNFDQRKAMLAFKVREAVGDNELLYESFKRAHAAFSGGRMSVVDFYNHSMDTVGAKALKTFIFELIALLPDIGKQEQLYQTVRMLLQPSSSQEKKTKLNRQMHWNIEPLQRCRHCKQLLDEADLISHQRHHES